MNWRKAITGLKKRAKPFIIIFTLIVVCLMTGCTHEGKLSSSKEITPTIVSTSSTNLTPATTTPV